MTKAERDLLLAVAVALSNPWSPLRDPELQCDIDALAERVKCDAARDVTPSEMLAIGLDN